ncbi:MAG: GNAT family N-acetyltransferase [Muribaculaceae bacterium]|nr:GNAT family N-acetyltransferase [Muribaculaceae bacterium]
MIDYKAIDFKGLNVIRDYLRWEDVQGCEWSGVNLLTWNRHGLEYAIVEGHLVLRFIYDGQYTHTMPLPPVPEGVEHPRLAEADKGCLARVVQTLREECFAYQQPFSITNLNQWQRDFLEQAFPGEFEFSKPLTERYDYICLRESIIALEGKEMRPKRQHLYQFPRFYPSHEYRPLAPTMFPECLRLLQQWSDNAEALGHIQGSDSKVMERESISYVFDHWNEFGAIGGALYVDGKMVAFTYGVPINAITFDLCVEKGDIAYKGVYTVVRHEFMKQIPEQFIYINLEEDMGLPGLRRAKSSYHPAYQIQKDRAVSWPELSVKAEEHKHEGVRYLMQTVFDDSAAALDIFFARVYTPEGNYCHTQQGHVVSAAQAIPYSLLYHGQQATAVYLYAVGTLPEYRGQHLMAQLFKHMHRGLLCQGKAFSTLLIEQEGLQEMYEKLGYAQVCTCPLQNENVVENGFDAYDQWQRSRPCVLLQNQRNWETLEVYSRFNKAYYLVKPHYKGMVRAINAMDALQLYAVAHPEVSLTLQVTGDDHLSENNGCYTIAGGAAQRIARCSTIETILTINQLAELLFEESPLEMPLMLL